MPWRLTVAQTNDPDLIKNAQKSGFFAHIVTSEETTLICDATLIPPSVKQESDWSALKVDGVLDFNLVGIIAGISAVLTKAGISIFVVSTFNTDYILVRDSQIEAATTSLSEAGYNIIK